MKNLKKLKSFFKKMLKFVATIFIHPIRLRRFLKNVETIYNNHSKKSNETLRQSMEIFFCYK